MTRVNVAVIGGGQNSEHAVSLASAASVAEALDPLRYRVTALTVGHDGTWLDASGTALGLGGAMRIMHDCDVVIPMIHGRHGEDGTMAALCEVVGVPYVGSGVEAGAIAMNKHLTKVVAESVGVKTAPGELLDRAQADFCTFRGPVVVKPNSGGSSVGVSLVTSGPELPAALDEALASDDRALVEQVIVGREIDIAIVRRADGSLLFSPALEIDVDGLFDEQSKYGGSAVFRIPAPLDSQNVDALKLDAAAVYEALGCSGVARIDFFLTAEGFVLNEVNTTPGFTPQSQVPRMFASAGIPYPQLLDLLIDDALELSNRAALQQITG